MKGHRVPQDVIEEMSRQFAKQNWSDNEIETALKALDDLLDLRELVAELQEELADTKGPQFLRRVNAITKTFRERAENAEGERDKWKQLAEFEYAVRAYPENLDLGEGALDEYFKTFTYDAAKKRYWEQYLKAVADGEILR